MYLRIVGELSFSAASPFWLIMIKQKTKSVLKIFWAIVIFFSLKKLPILKFKTVRRHRSNTIIFDVLFFYNFRFKFEISRVRCSAESVGNGGLVVRRTNRYASHFVWSESLRRCFIRAWFSTSLSWPPSSADYLQTPRGSR